MLMEIAFSSYKEKEDAALWAVDGPSETWWAPVRLPRDGFVQVVCILFWNSILLWNPTTCPCFSLTSSAIFKPSYICKCILKYTKVSKNENVRNSISYPSAIAQQDDIVRLKPFTLNWTWIIQAFKLLFNHITSSVTHQRPLFLSLSTFHRCRYPPPTTLPYLSWNLYGHDVWQKRLAFTKLDFHQVTWKQLHLFRGSQLW